MSGFFLSIYDAIRKHRWLSVMIILGITGLLVWMAFRVRLQEDISQFMPRDGQVKKYSDVIKNIRLNDKLVIAVHYADSVSYGTTDSLIAYAENLVQKIRDKGLMQHIRRLNFRLSEETLPEIRSLFYRNLPHYLDSLDYVKMDAGLNRMAIREKLQEHYQTLISPAGVAFKDWIASDPLGWTALALQKISSLQLSKDYTIIDDCIFTKDKQNLLIFVQSAYPSDQTALNGLLVDGIESSIAETGGNGIEAGYFGAVAVGAANARQMKKDTLLTMGLALGLLLLLLSFFYRRKRILLFLLLPVAMGALFALGMMQLITGSLSTIAIGAGSIILGIAINYSIHFYTHLKHTGDIRQTIRDLAGPMTIGSLTTIGAFLSLLFVESEALKDFGLFAALVLTGSVLASLIILPHLSGLSAKDQGRKVSAPGIIERFTALRFENSKIWLLVVGILTVFFMFFAPGVKFDSDLANMSYMPDELRETEKRLNSVTDTNLSALYLVSSGKQLDEALMKSEENERLLGELQERGVIHSGTGPGRILLSEEKQKEGLQRWERFWESRRDSLISILLEEARLAGFSGEAFDPFVEQLKRPHGICSQADRELIISELAGDYVITNDTSALVIQMVKAKPAQREALIAALPDDEQTTLIDRRHMATVFAGVIRDDFNRILLITSLLVLIFLTMSYGRLELGLLAFIPMLISWIWILGIMALLGIEFNVFSIILSAFIFGLGDDYSIFIMDGLLRKFRNGRENLHSYKTAVFLSALTTLTGVGVLIFAEHPALRSIALTTIIGMVSVVLVSFTVSPLIFKWMTETRKRKRTFPVTLGGVLYALVFYSYFIGGCIMTVLAGWTIIRLLPVGKKRRKLAYHYMLYLVCKSTIYIMFMVKKRFINFNKETFRKPCMVICNHQSLIDIPLALMWTPKMIMITNERVYYSPLIGKLVQLGGFFPASRGYEEISGKLKDLIAEGYSIFVFPEGTRSDDGRVKRFHKGAFYMAEELGLEILPMVMHGTGEYIRKGEYFGRRSAITVKFLDRILPGDLSFGESYTERTKSIQHLFRTEFDAIKEDYYSTVDYHKDLLIRNFIYKGPILEWYMRIKIRLEDNYRIFNDVLPKSGRITDIGCGYGFLSYMLALVSPSRQISGIDYDEDKIAVAAHGISRPSNTDFTAGDAMEVPFEKSRAFVIADVLHYMPEEWQKSLIRKCIDHLEPGGVIMIREGDSSMEKRHKGTALTEFFSTKVLGFNKTQSQNRLWFTSRETIFDSLKNTNFAVEIIDQTRFTSNIFYLIRERPAGG